MIAALTVSVLASAAIAALIAYSLTPTTFFQPVYCFIATPNTTLECDQSKDTLVITSTDSSISIVGNNATDTIDMQTVGDTLRSYQYCADVTCTVNNLAIGDTIFVWTKGSMTGTLSTHKISLNRDAMEIDSVQIGGLNTTSGSLAFALQNQHVATSTAHIYTVTSNATLGDVAIMIQVFR